MARAVLRDDLTYGLLTTPETVVVGLEDDCCAIGTVCPTNPYDPVGVSVNPIVSILFRTRMGYTEDGVPQFDWVTILSGPSIVYTMREEFDAEAGVTVIVGKVVMGNTTGLEAIPETAVVVDDQGNRWAVDSSATYPDRVELGLRRVWHEVQAT